MGDDARCGANHKKIAGKKEKETKKKEKKIADLGSADAFRTLYS